MLSVDFFHNQLFGTFISEIPSRQRVKNNSETVCPSRGRSRISGKGVHML